MEETKKSKWPRTRLLLVASLALNLLIVGIVAGAMLSGGGKQKDDHRRADRNLPIGPYARAFSKDDRTELRRAFEARKPWFDDRRAAMRGFAQELVQVVRVTPFDPDALRGVLDRQSTLQSTIRAEGHTILTERLTAMSDAQRQKFADRIERGLRRGKTRD